MSIHALLGTSLDDLERPSVPLFYEQIVENQIIRAMSACLIDIEDFHYYSARLRRICEQRKEAA
ncbi:hypothetical protein ACI2KS_10130 [Pseudomonas sp. NPDC087358]|uniref:hypothetical protein n=1 Tax=Pseudomonas sp. NPDC087358 TaxID=3364439 RepID=UPI00385115C6